MTKMTATTTGKASIAGNVHHVVGLSPDVWYLILQKVPDREHLASICRVCKGLYPLATQFLYKTITIGPPYIDFATFWKTINDEDRKSESTKWAESLALVRRLTADSNPNQTRAVCSINIESFIRHEWDKDALELGDLRPIFEQELPRLVNVLPNLRQENGSRPVLGLMPAVVTIKAKASPWHDKPDKPNTQLPGIQQLFFACPDLKSFSLSVSNDYGGCVRPYIHHSVTKTFQFASANNHLPFPPLESLSLSGYDMDTEQEWPHWRDGLDWSQVKTLTLGPNPRWAGGPTMADLLRQFKAHATALRSLTVQTWAAEGHETCHPLESFLASFDTLEELTVKRHFVPVQKLARHERLKRLCLHCIEVPRPDGAGRPTFGVEELVLLDKSCPELEELEIDISRDASGEWPRDILKALAGSFSNLRRLTLHCEVGLEFDWSRRQDKPYLPLLDEAFVRAFAEPFFALRGAGSKLERLTIKTGETLRRFPQWPPGYERLEKQSTRWFDAWLKNTDGEVKVKNVTPFILVWWAAGGK
ncbi:hypothetical protein N656DRAFT_830942 [Canariomyces notabilis]|uniref:F-box domain-containing protein n=1 Tax=Canariomyces notabilis TaxID=2074819 RepID=A0AAN6QPP5_9PEZI|nr:hypothetical protein N656DRAFT_830942 [Canariomyces arenarius]